MELARLPLWIRLTQQTGENSRKAITLDDDGAGQLLEVLPDFQRQGAEMQNFNEEDRSSGCRACSSTP